MYIYHALINALSAHMVHINLNMIFYTHVKNIFTGYKNEFTLQFSVPHLFMLKLDIMNGF